MSPASPSSLGMIARFSISYGSADAQHEPRQQGCSRTMNHLPKKNPYAMLEWIDQLPLPMLILVALMLGLAPFVPEPHLVEKIRMLFQGTLVKPIDIFDLCMHAAPIVVLAIRLVRDFQRSGVA